MNQNIVLEGKKLITKPGMRGVIVKQLSVLGVCSIHPKCAGPVATVRWDDGRERRECLYQLIKLEGCTLTE
jgi:hypothetical protein